MFLLFLLFWGNPEFICRNFRLFKLSASMLYCKEKHSKFSVMQINLKNSSKYLFQGQFAFVSETR